MLCVDVKGDVAASGSCDTTMRVWDLSTGNMSYPLTNKSSLSLVIFSLPSC